MCWVFFFCFANKKKKSLAVEMYRKQIAFSRSAVFSQQFRRSKQGYPFRVKNPQQEPTKKSCFPLTRKVHPRIFLIFFSFQRPMRKRGRVIQTTTTTTSSKKKCHRQPKKEKRKKIPRGNEVSVSPGEIVEHAG